MPITRYWSAKGDIGVQKMHVQFECPFFEELLLVNGGMLSRDLEAHALWDYYGNALISYDRAKKNIVLETDLSLKFNLETARQLFRSKAQQHGVDPVKMVRFWPMIMRQRIAMGGKDHLPDEFMFKWWGN